ncbi:MAG TPA: carboxynorspermidine decarboxylase, partial [Polyangiaceae bacterium]|nr:carboxynorspermidine decarboxylase [Polyangiaceae bacterium]
LAQKGFATWGVYPLVSQYLSGVTSSSVHEARLGREEFKKEVHVYAPAYSELDIKELCGQGEGSEASAVLADHIVFNSVSQFRKYAERVRQVGMEVGLRLNPQHREVETALYDPCAPGSRLGITLQSLQAAKLTGDEWSLIDGLHFHNLCQKNSDALERTLGAVERQFSWAFPHVKWLNFGGGHHISRPDYDVERLIRIVSDFRARTGKEVYLEPGEAVALSTGFLVSEVLDIVDGPGGTLPTAILDTSATAHMPDVLEMPYRPEILGGAEVGAKSHAYRLGGLTCLAGDVIGDWSFDAPLEVGDRLVFTDMAHYTSVKSTTFNGVRLPAVAVYEPDAGDGRVREIRHFGYADYRSRLS